MNAMPFVRFLCAALAWTAVGFQPATAQEEPKKSQCQIETLLDADTPRLRADNPFGVEGDARKVRLQGIDAPERCAECKRLDSAANCPDEACACRVATRALQTMIDEGGTTVVELSGKLDKYGRSLGRLLLRRADGTEVDPAFELLRTGQAVLFFKGNQDFFHDHPNYLEAARDAFDHGRVPDGAWGQFNNMRRKTVEERKTWYADELKKLWK